MVQYPHTISLTTNADSTQDADGNWTPGSTTTVEKACRAEPSGGNGYIRTADGSAINYNWIVYLPLPQAQIKIGTIVEIEMTDNDGGDPIIIKDKVLRFSRGQLNARIWL